MDLNSPIQYAKALKLRVIGIDISDSQLESAKSLSADLTFNSASTPGYEKEILSQTGGGVHAAVVPSASNAAYQDAPSVLKINGILMAIGIPKGNLSINALDILLGKYRIMGASSGTPQQMREPIKSSYEHGIKAHMTTFSDIGDIQKIIDLLENGKTAGRFENSSGVRSMRSTPDLIPSGPAIRMTKSQEIPGSTTSGPGIENEEFHHFLPAKSSRAQVSNLVYKMQSRPESSGASARSSSPDKSSTSEYPLQEIGTQYKDEARDSDELSLDLEIGDVPLLPSEAHGMEAQSEKFERDPPFSCTPSGFFAWLRGPTPVHVYHINPWFPRLQAAPARLIDQKFPRRSSKIGLLFGGLIFWIVVFFASLKASVAGQEVPGYGQPVKLSCHHRLWSNATNCGLNGDLCRPFEDQSFAFRCPSGCAAAILLEPYVVGDQELNYRPLVVGGKPFKVDGHHSGIYRGDSSICASALHAGLIDDARGGCGILHRTGEQKNFPFIMQHGIESIEFLSSFPMSFRLGNEASSPDSNETKSIKCSDARWSLFAFTLIWTTILSLVVTSAPAFYSMIYFIVWFQVAMASDPPSMGSYYDLVSIALGRFLPGAFVGFVLYYFCVRHTLKNLDAHWDKTVLWLGGCWVGALNTDTFDRIPISRLTPHDIQQQPGALTALIIVVGSLIAIAFGQAHCFRREGRFFPTISIYGVLVAVVLLLVAVPHMNLRIHHYILSLLFLPGTTMQTRPSLLYSGILIGLFINGIARWGFDSILQTPGALLDGAKLGTVPPKIYPPSLTDVNNLVFSFPDLEPHADGLSVLVNDVERFQVFRPKDGQPLPDFTWSRTYPNELEYFRFGLVHTNPLGGLWYEDFSPPAVWEADGNFVFPDPEISEDPESESE